MAHFLNVFTVLLGEDELLIENIYNHIYEIFCFNENLMVHIFNIYPTLRCENESISGNNYEKNCSTYNICRWGILFCIFSALRIEDELLNEISYSKYI